MSNVDDGQGGRERPSGPWTDRVRIGSRAGSDPFAYRPGQVVTGGGDACRAAVAELAAEASVVDLGAGFHVSGVDDPLGLVDDLQARGHRAHPNHVYFAHDVGGCDCCPPHPAAGAGAGANPVYATPVYATPVYATPVYATPVYATPVYATPVYATPMYATPMYATPVYATMPVHSSARPVPPGTPMAQLVRDYRRGADRASANVIVLDTGLAVPPVPARGAGRSLAHPGRVPGRRGSARRERRPPARSRRRARHLHGRGGRSGGAGLRHHRPPGALHLRRRRRGGHRRLPGRHRARGSDSYHPEPVLRRLRARPPSSAGPGRAAPPAAGRGGGGLGRQRRHVPAHLSGGAGRGGVGGRGGSGGSGALHQLRPVGAGLRSRGRSAQRLLPRRRRQRGRPRRAGRLRRLGAVERDLVRRAGGGGRAGRHHARRRAVRRPRPSTG